MKINYNNAIELLKQESKKIVEKLQDNKTSELLHEKKNIDNAIKWLRKGMDNEVNPNLTIIKLPEQKTQTPSSEFRLIEDHESDDKKDWTEVKVDNKELRPTSNDFFIMEEF